MGSTTDRSAKNAGTDISREHRELALQRARKHGAAEFEAEDIAQVVLLKLWERAQTVDHPKRWLYRVARNETMSYRRREKPGRKSVELTDDAAQFDPRDLDPESLTWRGIIAELETYLDHHEPSGDAFRELFRASLLVDQQAGYPSPLWQSARTDTALAARRAKPTISRELRALGAHFGRQGFSWEDVLGALREPNFLLSSCRLARLAGDEAASFTARVCNFIRRARLDLVLRAKPDRHNFSLPMQRAFWSMSEFMFAISRMHSKYMILGGLSYLQNILRIPSADHVSLVDGPVYDRILRPFLSPGSRANYADRWLATALYGALSEYTESSPSQLDDHLSELLGSTEQSSLQTIGLGWSWLNVSRVHHASALRDKLVSALKPGQWVAGLATLPTVMVSPFLSEGAGGLRAACANPALWEVVVEALSSPSQVAVLGGLVFLSNVSPTLCEPSAQDEICRSLRKHTDTPNPLLAEKFELVQAWGSDRQPRTPLKGVVEASDDQAD